MWLLPEEADAEGASLVASCELFEEGKARQVVENNGLAEWQDTQSSGNLQLLMWWVRCSRRHTGIRTRAPGASVSGKQSQRS